MITSDAFVIIVPVSGKPFLAEPGSDLSSYIGDPFMRINETVALKDGRSLSGSIFRGRRTSATDEIDILELLNQRFSK